MSTSAIRSSTTPLANTTTAPVALSPDTSHNGHGDGISQATEHFLIAAGSIGKSRHLLLCSIY